MNKMIHVASNTDRLYDVNRIALKINKLCFSGINSRRLANKTNNIISTVGKTFENAKKITFAGSNVVEAFWNSYNSQFQKLGNVIHELGTKCQKLKHIEFIENEGCIYTKDYFEYEMKDLLKRLKMIEIVTLKVTETGKKFDYALI